MPRNESHLTKAQKQDLVALLHGFDFVSAALEVAPTDPDIARTNARNEQLPALADKVKEPDLKPDLQLHDGTNKNVGLISFLGNLDEQQEAHLRSLMTPIFGEPMVLSPNEQLKAIQVMIQNIKASETPTLTRYTWSYDKDSLAVFKALYEEVEPDVWSPDIERVRKSIGAAIHVDGSSIHYTPDKKRPDTTPAQYAPDAPLSLSFKAALDRTILPRTDGSGSGPKPHGGSRRA